MEDKLGQFNRRQPCMSFKSRPMVFKLKEEVEPLVAPASALPRHGSITSKNILLGHRNQQRLTTLPNQKIN